VTAPAPCRHAVVARLERSEIRDAFRLHDYLGAFWAVTSKEQRLRPIEELRARLEGENDDNAVRSLNEWIRVLGH
jgi:DNA-binding GntR family transcriptional regulator